jgi:pimeloyl-ACP methyl ester carboxylesterase
MDSADLTELLNQFRIGSHNDALSFVDRFQGVARARHVFAWGARIRMGRASVQSLVEQIEVHHLLTAEDLAALTLPVLVFWGRRDRVLPGHAVEFFREHLRHGTFLEPEGYGHAPYLDHLKPFVEQCRDFLVGPSLAS